MTLYAVYATNEDGSFSWIDSYWLNYENAMEIDEYETMIKKQNKNAELIKQIEKTEKELAELKTRLK